MLLLFLEHLIKHPRGFGPLNRVQRRGFLLLFAAFDFATTSLLLFSLFLLLFFCIFVPLVFSFVTFVPFVSLLLHHLFSLHRLSPCTQIVYPLPTNASMGNSSIIKNHMSACISPDDKLKRATSDMLIFWEFLT